MNPVQALGKGTLQGRAFLNREFRIYHGKRGRSNKKFQEAELNPGQETSRAASTRKRAMAALAETFRLSMPPGMGISSSWSQRSWIF